jgi:DNA-binding NtrC family response regulator
LNVIPVVLPPLRERREDIPLLARHFLEKCCRELNLPLMTLTPEAMQALEAYQWPGNVREMENVIERSVTLTEGERIELRDLPPDVAGSEAGETGMLPYPGVTLSGLDLPELIARLERDLIRDAMALTGGVKAQAATLLGLNRTTLVEKIKRLGLTF